VNTKARSIFQKALHRFTSKHVPISFYGSVIMPTLDCSRSDDLSDLIDTRASTYKQFRDLSWIVKTDNISGTPSDILTLNSISNSQSPHEKYSTIVEFGKATNDYMYNFDIIQYNKSWVMNECEKIVTHRIVNMAGTTIEHVLWNKRNHIYNLNGSHHLAVFLYHVSTGQHPSITTTLPCVATLKFIDSSLTQNLMGRYHFFVVSSHSAKSIDERYGQKIGLFQHQLSKETRIAKPEDTPVNTVIAITKASPKLSQLYKSLLIQANTNSLMCLDLNKYILQRLTLH
jgi:hypothetical protein